MEDEGEGGLRSESGGLGGRGKKGTLIGGADDVETYSSIQLIKIPLSKKPVKFRYVWTVLFWRCRLL